MTGFLGIVLIVLSGMAIGFGIGHRDRGWILPAILLLMGGLSLLFNFWSHGVEMKIMPREPTPHHLRGCDWNVDDNRFDCPTREI